ncbi:phospholipase D-like protein [Halalkalibacter nanhaiisediminis]|uniref:phospholipase D n=1 Tax=Halalkalibacter nanhaiisediminis TaxID=688079 RepID=A0A562Q819_9BACI|nr:phospholipase D-like protein [Halalkalibacter nanhaiisediminis]
MVKSFILTFSKKVFSKKISLILLVLLFIYIGGIIYGVYRPLPHEDLSFQGDEHLIESPTFLTDVSYEKDGSRVYEHDIFDYSFKVIDEAEELIVVDMFLFHDVYDEGDSFPPLTDELTDALIHKKQNHPSIEIVVITDPVNSMYGAYEPEHFLNLKEAGIPVVVSELTPLRDSNPLYSSAWRLILRWFDYLNWTGLPHPQGSNGEDVTIHSYLTALNGKANHRKLIITEKEAIVSSANPHDASALHSNVAFAVKGTIINDLLQTEQAVTEYSANLALPTVDYTDNHGDQVTSQVLTEGKIREKLLELLSEASSGDTIWIALLYLSERDVIGELLDASERGVDVKIVLDQNIESFGQEKNGLPNKPVAEELISKSDGKIDVRWYETEEEQYHPKLLFIDGPDKSQIISGSANFTRRNLRDLTLETSLFIEAPTNDAVSTDVREYFTRIWTNENGIYTTDYETHSDDSLWLRALYRLQKLTNTSTY